MTDAIGDSVDYIWVYIGGGSLGGATIGTPGSTELYLGRGLTIESLPATPTG